MTDEARGSSCINPSLCGIPQDDPRGPGGNMAALSRQVRRPFRHKSQKAVTACSKSKRLPPFSFARAVYLNRGGGGGQSPAPGPSRDPAPSGFVF